MTDWADLPTIIKVDVVVIHVMFLGQTIFLAMWSVLRWWKEWVGRALMVKTVSLWLLIAAAVLNFWLVISLDKPWAYWEPVMVATHVFVVVGVWSQVAAIGNEMLKAKHGPGEVRNAQEEYDGAPSDTDETEGAPS